MKIIASEKKDRLSAARRLFTETDYALVRILLKDLPERKRRILEEHFWEGLSLTEIATGLKIGWAEINQEINEAFIILKERCEKDPRFSRYRKENENPAKDYGNSTYQKAS